MATPMFKSTMKRQSMKLRQNAAKMKLQGIGDTEARDKPKNCAEDDPCWDPRTMGNRRWGPGGLENTIGRR